MIVQNWMTYVFMIVIVIAIYWAVARVRGDRFDLRRALIQCAFACVGLTVYYLILAW